jgi:uncharacterized HAD superfamily protein
MKNLKKNIQAILNVNEIPYPSLGIDIDGCIDEATGFFQILSTRWPGKVFIISYRDNIDAAKKVLNEYGIHYTDLILVNSFDEKAKVIQENGISIFFDDQPEMLKEVAPNCHVMLVRNEGNFDFNDKKWMLDHKTGKII